MFEDNKKFEDLHDTLTVRASCDLCPDQTSSEQGAVGVFEWVCIAGLTGSSPYNCTPCPEGTFKSVPGSQACTACPTGTYRNTTGGVHESDCSACPLNHFCGSGTVRPQPKLLFPQLDAGFHLLKIDHENAL